MSILRPKLAQSLKDYKEKSSFKSKIENSGAKTSETNEEKTEEEKRPNINIDYKSSNYFYNNDEDYFKVYPYKRMEYYNTNDNRGKYNIDSNSSHITVENEDGFIKYIPTKNYNYNYNDISPQKNINYIEISSHKNNDYYDDIDNSEYSENNDNDNENLYYENVEGIINNNKSTRIKYNHLKRNINCYLPPNKKQIKKKSQNIITKAISHEVNFSNEKNLKMRPIKKNMHNCGNNTTTTNNTYNNNIYYINPINVKNKLKEKNTLATSIKSKKSNNNKKNYIYKSVDITLQKRRNKEKDYFKINNIDKSKKEIYIKSAILIQSVFRGYLVKIKLYNNVNLYVCCKRGIDTLEEILLQWKNEYWKIFKNNINNKPLMKSSSFSIRAKYKYKLRNNKIREPKINLYHKEIGDSFNIIDRDSIKSNIEKKLKLKLNDVIKENYELKNQLINNRNNSDIKLKSLIDENRKVQNINAIIMKDNRQLAKKLKDFHDYRNHRLFIENQFSFDLSQIEKMQSSEYNENNEIYLFRLKIMFLQKFVLKKINMEKNLIKDKINKYRNIVQILHHKEEENSLKKEIYIINVINIIEKHIKLLLEKCFWYIFFNGLNIEREIEIQDNTIIEKFQRILHNKEKKNRMILQKMFYKFFINSLKINDKNGNKEIAKEEKGEKEKENLKLKFLKKIFVKYEKNVKLIYKVIMEKWNLKSKIIGIRTAARDKKKKRKMKKKNNKLLYRYGIGENYHKNNYAPKFCKSIHEFSYIISNGNNTKESNQNELKRDLLENKSTKNINNSKMDNSGNEFNDKEIKKKKTKSVNRRRIFEKKDSINNLNNNEESDEDSGDSLGLDNNSDC